jgi:hypothetical protein
MNTLQNLEKTIAQSTGKSIEYLRDTPLCEIRREAEQKSGHPTEITDVKTETIYVMNMPIRVIFDSYLL